MRIRFFQVFRFFGLGQALVRPAPVVIEKKKGKVIVPVPDISLLIPFSSPNLVRHKTFKWLIKYWTHELPDAEIIIGHSRAKVFSKGRALNNSARKATGKVLVVLDADAYLAGSIIQECADQILGAGKNHLWFVPYRRLYRLSKAATMRILESDPLSPLRIKDPCPAEDVDEGGKDKEGYGHRFGAMVTVMPREALDCLGCFDERFKGWGGEDVAILRALDTLYGLHKTVDAQVLHLHHPFIGADYKSRAWKGQKKGGANNALASRYNAATGNPGAMRALVDQGCRKIKTDSLF